MQATEFLKALRTRWLYVLFAVLLAVGAASYLTASAPRIYESKASLYFSLPFGGSASDLFQGSNYTQQQLASYATLATKPIVLDRVVEDVGFSTTTGQLAASVSAIASRETVIVDITASNESPERAAAVANAVARSLSLVVRDLAPTDAQGEPVVAVAVIAQATAPSSPASPNVRINLVAGVVAGLFLGVMLAVARDRLDTRVRDASDLPEGLTVLGSISFDKAVKRAPLSQEGANSRSRAESFRSLRTNLRFMDVDEPVRVLSVTSAIAGEGKSSTAVNLAVVFAEAGQRVLLVDADLRRPRLAEYLGLESAVGLSDALSGRAELAEVLQPGPADLLSVLTSGTIPPNPSELLGSQKMAQGVATLRGMFDYIIIDTPPLLPVTDASIVAVYADGVVLVAAYEKTKHSQLGRALESLSAVSAKHLGVVFNMVPRSGGDEAGGYEYYGEPEHRAARTPRALSRRGAKRGA